MFLSEEGPSVQIYIWSLLKRGINGFERDNFSRKVDHRKNIRLKSLPILLHACVIFAHCMLCYKSPS